ncbi:hypothetical protein [Methylobacterium aerolatum]|uniref:Uncharacterized protein n=1 Tax=Methylobacterium aerolatum TaxID=418708 RepID=A0ABU0I5Q7_9HYPH|nr:hypothetical protein [Methylobacterium aerolatum]MDQ0449006.1 hypothetical protein [Methylobacterium aerolatum]GJD35194.1 hypothetical protein FMGBMHLM_2103 [Methylobacterium aerolatum]
MSAPVSTLFLAAALGGTLLAGPASAGGCYGRECYRYAVSPPVYAVEQENVLVSPPRTVYQTVPPVYDTVSEQVLVAPGGRVWQTRPGPNGELIGCWIETPPRYAVRQRTVLVRPAETVPVTLAPQYATVSHRVRVAPARAGWVPLRAGYARPRDASLLDWLGMTGGGAADVGVGLGLARGSIYDGY